MRFLFVDRLLQLSPAKFVQGIKHITCDDFYLTRDDEGKFCFIPSLIGESLGQLTAWNVMFVNDFTKRPVAGLAARARVFRPAYVGETLLLESFIDQLDEAMVQYHSVARIGSEVVFTIDGALGPLLPMDDFIDPLLIRQQFDEINRPGQWVADTQFNNGSLMIKGEEPRVVGMLFDRVFDSEPGVRLRAEKRVSRAAPYFPDHFPNKPVLPMTVLLECKLNLVQEFLSRAQYPTAYTVHELRKIKMNEFVYPGDVVITTLSVKKQDVEELVITFRSEVDGKRVCVLDMVLR